MKKNGMFPRPGMVASGESSVPFSGADVVSGYQPSGWNKGIGQELDPVPVWGNTGIGGQRGPIDGVADAPYCAMAVMLK